MRLGPLTLPVARPGLFTVRGDRGNLDGTENGERR
jgi:hypothetical protein